MRVAVYARVSTGEQDLDHQVKSLWEFAKARGYEVVRTYTDVLSGSKDSRPGLNNMLMDAYNARFEAVVVWKLDRLGRSLQHLLTVINNFEKWGVGFVCQTQPFDTTTSGGRLIFQIFGAMAEFERSLISERTKLGLRKAKNVGKRGRDVKPRKKSGYYLRYQKQKKGEGVF